MLDEDADEIPLRRGRRVVQRRPVECDAAGRDFVDAVGHRAATVLEQDQIAERLVRGAPHLDLAVGLHGRRNGRREPSDTAVEEEFLRLSARLDGRRVGSARLVVMAGTALGRERLRLPRRDPDVRPGQGALIIRAVITAHAGPGVRKPFREASLPESDVDAHGCLSRGVEVQHRRFHANGAPHADLDFNEVSLDEAREITLAALGQPLKRLAVFAGDRRERAPFVDGERRGLLGSLGRGQRGGGGNENDGRGKANAHMVLPANWWPGRKGVDYWHDTPPAAGRPDRPELAAGARTGPLGAGRRRIHIDAVALDRTGSGQADLKPAEVEVWIGVSRRVITVVTPEANPSGRLTVLMLDDVTGVAAHRPRA